MKPSELTVISSDFRRLSLIIYLQLKPQFKHKRGAPFKVSLTEQILLTLFKLKYNLPDRVLEHLFKIDHVTISRIILRISIAIADLNLAVNTSNEEYYIVDSTLIKIGKDKTAATYTGYKHMHGIKFQVITNDHNQIRVISNSHPASIHDKKIFNMEYDKVKPKIDTTLDILGDRAYVGLSKEKVITPFKLNELRYKTDTQKAEYYNQQLSAKRVRIEHVFAWLKHYRILRQTCYYAVSKINIFFKAITNLYNLSKAV